MTDLVELRFESVPTTPRAARRAIELAFAEHPRIDDLLLCLSEVVTNAVLHAGTAIAVTAGKIGEVIRIAVTDGSPVTPTRQSFESLSPTGRGLHLLDRLTLRWGVEFEREGKTVWFEMGTEEPA